MCDHRIAHLFQHLREPQFQRMQALARFRVALQFVEVEPRRRRAEPKAIRIGAPFGIYVSEAAA